LLIGGLHPKIDSVYSKCNKEFFGGIIPLCVFFFFSFSFLWLGLLQNRGCTSLCREPEIRGKNHGGSARHRSWHTKVKNSKPRKDLVFRLLIGSRENVARIYYLVLKIDMF
jgi:hypothetical protein